MALRLTMGFSDNPRVQPLKDGIVKPQGIELDCVTLDPSNLFQRNLTYDEFDVSEMSISETLLARERTDGKKWDWSHGIEAKDNVWYNGRTKELSHGGALGLDTDGPAGRTHHRVTGGQTLGAAAERGGVNTCTRCHPRA